jgi:glyoxylase-like metal-dependent hydrolase (beta-lactamase superfamily II)
MKIHRFINSPVPSNTYIIEDESSKECVVIDPGTNGSEDIINFISNNHLIPVYILLTHGDFDHVWGVNALKATFPDIQIVASKETSRLTSIPQSYFSALYFGKPEPYCIEKIDYVVDEHDNQLIWRDNEIRFIQVPGHTSCSNIILFNDLMFSGDTILKDTKPFIQKRHGGDKDTFKKSVRMILDSFQDDTEVYPGHGESFHFGEVRDYYETYLII